MPAYCRPAAYREFSRQMSHVDTTCGLFRAACAIALHEHPAIDISDCERVVGELADTVRRRVQSGSVDARLAHLHDLMFDVVGFIGNVEDYYNPANSYLPEVLKSRRGLPISLVLIYKSVAERVGLRVMGINSPGHFLAAVETGDGIARSRPKSARMYVDPFYGGALLDEGEVVRRIRDSTGWAGRSSPDWLREASHRQWLARMLNNLQAIFAHSGRERDLLAMQELEGLLNQTGGA